MTLKKVIQSIKVKRRLTYKEMEQITGIPKLTLQNYGCARNESIGYKNAIRISETLGIKWEVLQPYVR